MGRETKQRNRWIERGHQHVKIDDEGIARCPDCHTIGAGLNELECEIVRAQLATDEVAPLTTGDDGLTNPQTHLLDPYRDDGLDVCARCGMGEQELIDNRCPKYISTEEKAAIVDEANAFLNDEPIRGQTDMKGPGFDPDPKLIPLNNSLDKFFVIVDEIHEAKGRLAKQKLEVMGMMRAAKRHSYTYKQRLVTLDSKDELKTKPVAIKGEGKPRKKVKAKDGW